MAVIWTSQQKEVIESDNCNLLVSAAAGSGKTAVLVERIIDRLTREDHPADISRLLVVTFTKAAAAEMRERIGKGIDKKLEENPDSRYLQHQKLVLQAAQISTIHSLCKTLIQENFETLEIDPSFRIGEENELKILQQDVAADMLEGYYASGNQQFREFVDRYGGKRADEGIAEMILETYKFSRGCVSPDYWLDSCPDIFSGKAGEGKVSLADWITRSARRTIETAVGLLQKGLELALSENGPIQYEEAISSDLDQLILLLEEDGYDRIRKGLQSYKPEALSRKRPAGGDPDKKAKAQDLRNQAKDNIVSFTKNFLKESGQDLEKETEYLRPSIRMLTELVKEFGRRYQAEKTERGMMDYSDLEHETLRLLAVFDKDENGDLQITATAAADRIAASYDEIICDEYQDSNQVQEEILRLLSGNRSGRNNRFMVGDVKQSIYRFRQADSSIFVKKAEEYARDGCASRRIDLNQNFRSRIHILEGINLLFSYLMTEETSGITYDEREALRRDPDNLFPEEEGRSAASVSDVVLVELDKNLMTEARISKEELEAAAIAEKIMEVTDPDTGLDVYDSSLPEGGGYRRARYGDIAVLFRSSGETAEMLVRILSGRGIPVTAQESKGFFETLEIRTMTALLEVIDNPEQDIPMAAVLRAPFVGLTSEELALLRVSCKDKSLIEACRACGEDLPGADKVHHFLQLLEEMRRASDYMEMDEFIRYLYEKTGYYTMTAAMPSGPRRQANLDLLLDSAVTFSKGSMSGLFSFVRYLDQIRKNQFDAGEASPDAAENSVQIMTIHKSKGLEFPIVIVGQAGKQFNRMDESGTAILHREYGIGMDLHDLASRRKVKSASKRFIAAHLEKETKAEEMRILYVAMTRAKEKLIMTGCVENLANKQDKWDSLRKRKEDPEGVLSASCYLDWIMPGVLEDEEEKLFRQEHWNTTFLLQALISRTGQEKEKRDCLRENAPDVSGRFEDLLADLTGDSSWTYRWEALSRIKGKYSVSELKSSSYQDEEAQPLIVPERERTKRVPAFMQEAEKQDKEPVLTGAMRGTAFHRVMELLDFASCPESGQKSSWLAGQIKAMEDAGRLGHKQAEAVYRKGIITFLESGLGQRMVEAARKGCLHKESQFVMSLPLSAVIPGAGDGDDVVLQGIVDAWFTENDRIVLMDYKTDRVSTEDGEAVLSGRYARQLEYYSRALSNATGLEIGEKWIYSFCLNREIPI